ncbi:MAG TPA: hypothetical protein VF605_11260 [Allosphingosinicella sp.]
MHAPASAAASRRSPWAGLDALVLEEIEALRTPPPPLRRVPPAPAPAFASDDEFLVSALRYLAGHADPAGLVARLSAGFQLATAEPESPAASDEEAPAAAAPDEAGAAAAPDRPVADAAGEEDRP